MISSASHNPNWNEFRLCGGGAGAGARSCARYNWSESVVGPLSLCGLMIRLPRSETVIRSCEGEVWAQGGRAYVCWEGTVVLARPVVRKWKSSQFAPQRRAIVNPPLSVYPFNLIHLQWFVTPLHRGVCWWQSGVKQCHKKLYNLQCGSASCEKKRKKVCE